jgi:hypothetical protein
MSRLADAVVYTLTSIAMLLCIAMIVIAIVAPTEPSLKKTALDGHSYMVVQGYRSIALIHDPDCKCKSTDESEQ